MSLIRLFGAQRAAFEQAYADGDWGRLEPFFHKDAVYEVANAPFHCVIAGRAAILAGFQRSIERFDKHCERHVGIGSVVFEEGDNVLVHSGLQFRRGDSPALESKLWEIATYRDGLITRMMDIYDPGDGARFSAWMAQWGDGLDARYCE